MYGTEETRVVEGIRVKKTRKFDAGAGGDGAKLKVESPWSLHPRPPCQAPHSSPMPLHLHHGGAHTSAYPHTPQGHLTHHQAPIAMEVTAQNRRMSGTLPRPPPCQVPAPRTLGPIHTPKGDIHLRNTPYTPGAPHTTKYPVRRR